jgi:hypothetical protein
MRIESSKIITHVELVGTAPTSTHVPYGISSVSNSINRSIVKIGGAFPHPAASTITLDYATTF